ncbi:DUF255 domain-containing protein [Mycobacterium leprae]|uniref:U1740f n=2 Tax=Mycobacterium leprae TaxID=1769 RepID=Q50062_MYCLR|nr:u1740f [Mycobacterium leprae]
MKSPPTPIATDLRYHRNPALTPADSPRANILGLMTSPYLCRHTGNPVHWQQWTSRVLAGMAARDVPILLSAGYAIIDHWCHITDALLPTVFLRHLLSQSRFLANSFGYF